MAGVGAKMHLQQVLGLGHPLVPVHSKPWRRPAGETLRRSKQRGRVSTTLTGDTT